MPPLQSPRTPATNGLQQPKRGPKEGAGKGGPLENEPALPLPLPLPLPGTTGEKQFATARMEGRYPILSLRFSPQSSCLSAAGIRPLQREKKSPLPRRSPCFVSFRLTRRESQTPPACLHREEERTEEMG